MVFVEWVLRAAQEAGKDVKGYGLPEDGEALHLHINAKLDEFERLVTDLKGSRRLKTLRRLLKRAP